MEIGDPSVNGEYGENCEHGVFWKHEGSMENPV